MFSTKRGAENSSFTKHVGMGGRRPFSMRRHSPLDAAEPVRIMPHLMTLLLCAWLAVAPPQRPFDTLLPWALERGRWEVGAGLLRRKGASPPFFSGVPEARRDEWRLSLVDAALGLGGGGEVQLR